MYNLYILDKPTSDFVFFMLKMNHVEAHLMVLPYFLLLIKLL